MKQISHVALIEKYKSYLSFLDYAQREKKCTGYMMVDQNIPLRLFSVQIRFLSLILYVKMFKACNHVDIMGQLLVTK